jgi:hypothetical protein
MALTVMRKNDVLPMTCSGVLRGCPTAYVNITPRSSSWVDTVR